MPVVRVRIDEFCPKLMPEPMSGCWIWLGHLNNHGYGKQGTNYAHRLAWQQHKGVIPAGLHVLHRCDNPACCNPDHLKLGTRADNLGDAAAKGRLWNSRKTHCPSGHPYDEENTMVGKTTWGGLGRWCKICHAAARKRYNAKKTMEGKS